MISRIYADNFRCLSNFELNLDRLNLLVGPNGSGKSTVFEVLRKLQRFVVGGDLKVETLFPARELNRWQSSREQRFELDLVVPEGSFQYVLVIEHMDGGQKSRVREESLTEQGKPLFRRLLAEIQLYRNDFSEGPTYPFNWSLPALATIQPSPANTKLMAFRREMSRLVIASISPTLMDSGSHEEAEMPEPQMENFVSWFRRLSQENMGSISHLFQELAQVLPGFVSFSFRDAGEDRKLLKILLDRGDNGGKSQATFDFGELSDGQRVLVVLYTLVFGLRGSGLSLFLDEPDNFVALREIQPWLSNLSDECGEGFEQAVLISHHPEIINYLGGSSGRFFSRDRNGPVRVHEVAPQITDGLNLAETIARGWDV